MAAKYKAADTALNRATASIQALRQSITQKDEVIILRGDEIKNLRILVDNLRQQDLAKNELFFIEKAAMKTKLKKRNRIIAGQSGLIAVLIAIVLLL